MSAIIDPIQSLINQAAKKKPTKALEQYSERLNANLLGKSIIALDTSSSMNDYVGEKRKIDILRQAVDRPLLENEVVLNFCSDCWMIKDFQSIPEPWGSTSMHSALIMAITMNPRHTLIVSDGQPDSRAKALSVAKTVPGIISTLFIGDENDLDAVSFMAKLAKIGCGKSEVCDISNPQNQLLLKATINILLPGS